MNKQEETTWQAANLARIEERLADVREQEDDTLFTEWWAGHFVVLTKVDGHLRLWLMEEEAANTTWVQSILDLYDPLHLVFGYTQAMLLALAWQPAPRRVFVSGLGGGSLPLVMHHHFPHVVLDCVEISPAVVEAATQHMPLPQDERMTIAVADAADFLAAQPPQTYDLLLLDLFTDGGKTPGHLTERAFFQHCHDCLTAGGALAMNLCSQAQGHADRLQRVRDVFEDVHICQVHGGVDVVLAAKGQRLSRFEILHHCVEVQRRRQFHFRLPDWVKNI
ncbi:MAG: fused MFS/spermidine synthase [Caldilineaceae bacterium]